jgi:hypothetical protein
VGVISSYLSEVLAVSDRIMMAAQLIRGVAGDLSRTCHLPGSFIRV